jgi:hypothetical protein
MSGARNDLIDAVQHGRMSPDDADAEALRLGLEPLSYRPDPAAFDPLREPYWTPVMAVAWIAWRTRDAVREVWLDYRKRCRRWRSERWSVGFDGPVLDGHFLEEDAPVSLVDLHFRELADHREAVAEGIALSVGPALELLLGALRTGALHGTALPVDGGPREQVPSHLWIDLKPVFTSDEDRFVPRPAIARGGYRQVLVPREQVLKLWKPAPARRPVELPPVVRPDDPGYMTVFHALLWIATRGGVEPFEPGDVGRWREAFDYLMPEIASGHVALTGRRVGGEPEVVPPHVVAYCRFDPPFADTSDDLPFGTDLYLRSFPYLDDEHWRNGFDDALIVGHDERWNRLMVPKADVRKVWPFNMQPRKSGAPGRPSAMDLVEKEFQRRVAAGELKETLAAQSKVLAGWLQDNHPGEPPLTPKTIENKLRESYRAARPPK